MSQTVSNKQTTDTLLPLRDLATKLLTPAHVYITSERMHTCLVSCLPKNLYQHGHAHVK